MGSRAARWPLVVALVAAAAAALFLGAALAETASGPAAGLVVLALASFLVSAAAGGAVVLAIRRSPTDAVIERAETAARLAHELRDPLMSIKGLAATGVKLFDRMSDDEREELFRLIDEEAARLVRVAEQTATAMRIDAERLVYDLREEDLGALVEEVAWETPHREHPMSVETQPGISVLLDRRRLAEALANLIDNAAKYSPPDAPIRVSARRGPDGTAVIEVADRGPGIPPERLEEVFQRFGRWRPAGYQETPGAGLGLFIARAHVAAHGGGIAVVEREDGGTILRITLPAGG